MIGRNPPAAGLVDRTVAPPPDFVPEPVHRYLAGEIDRDRWLESHHVPAVELAATDEAVIALAEALGVAAADLWLDGRLELPA